MSIGQFGTILMICCAFYKDKEKFVKYFYICTIAMISIVLVYFFFNHSVYSIQGVKIKGRLGTEGVNPIEMSRMFAIGALSLMLWGRFSYWIKVVLCIPFFIGMILTGSRGPVISVSIVLACHYLWTQSQHRLIAIRLFLSCVLLIIALWTVGAYFQDPIDKYFTRGHRQGMYQGSGRYSAALVTWKEFVSEPFWGVGLGKYGKPGTQASPTIDLSNKPINRDYPHNILYEVAAELGIVGIILFIFLLRPGAWVFDFSNKFIYLFFLCFLFAMTSGDFFDNAGVFTFAYIARLNRKPKVE
jgi:O-antigen ligase